MAGDGGERRDAARSPARPRPVPMTQPRTVRNLVHSARSSCAKPSRPAVRRRAVGRVLAARHRRGLLGRGGAELDRRPGSVPCRPPRASPGAPTPRRTARPPRPSSATTRSAAQPGHGQRVGAGDGHGGAGAAPAAVIASAARGGAQRDPAAGRGARSGRRRWCRRPPGRGRPRPGGRRCPAARSSGGWTPARPGPRRPATRRKPRIQTMPSGSRPLNGSSSISTGGSPSMAAAMPEPLAHAERVAAGLAPGRRRKPGLLDHLVDPPGRQALGVGQPQQVVAGAAAGLQRGGVQQRADVAERVPQARGRAGRRPGRVPSSAASRPRITRMVVDLPAPFGPTKPVTCPGVTVNVSPSRATVVPEPLAQAGDLDGCFHARHARRAAAAVVTPRSDLRRRSRGGAPDARPSQGGRRYRWRQGRRRVARAATMPVCEPCDRRAR